MEEVRGYKVFKPDWTCRDKQYSCPGEFEEDVTPIACVNGMHFCPELNDCFEYYEFDPENKVAEVVAYGDVVYEGNKACTNKLRIIREITWEEVLRMLNTGKGNSGRCNSGDCNSGNWNSGNWNSGDCNSGDCNSGNRNSGNRNSGDCNKTSFSSGCFNTEEQKILMFNKPSEWTYRDWFNSKARYLMNQIQSDVVEWIWASDMTDEEKKAHPEYETTGGYLKELSNEDCCANWWKNLSDEEKGIILAIPNFDAEIFEQITGIKVNE